MPREPHMPLPGRTLGRTAAIVPPVLWEVASIPDPQVLQACADAGANWAMIPDDSDALHIVPDAWRQWSIVLSVEAQSVLPRAAAGMRPVREALARLGRPRLSAVLLRDLDANDAKAGWPFHRLAQMRERGLADWAFVETSDVATAEWMVEHSPAHAVVLPYSIDQQLAGYRVLGSAQELGTALVARLPDGASLDDVRFVAGEQRVAALLYPLPSTLDELHQIIDAIRDPMPAAQRESLWSAYQHRIPAPPKPRSSHPPEYGA